jgi:DNA-binding MarR family transcriptional regulator
MTQHYEAAFKGSGIRATQFTVLATLMQTGPIPVSQLAKTLGLERTTLTRNLVPLESRGLVRISGGSDARVREVCIQPDGVALARRVLPRWEKAQRTAPALLKKFPIH